MGKAELQAAYRAIGLFDAHRHDPQFGYQFLVQEAGNPGEPMSARTAWRICSTNGWWQVLSKTRQERQMFGTAAHDDLRAIVDEHGVTPHAFTAAAVNQLWLDDITEHRTCEGKLYLCAVKDAYSNRIVDNSIDSRMKSRLAVGGPDNAAGLTPGQRHRGCRKHPAHRSKIAISRPEARPSTAPLRYGRFRGPGRRRARNGIVPCPALRMRPQPTPLEHP